MQRTDQPGYPPPPPPPPPEQSPPGWQTAIVTVLRILFGMWVVLLCWISAFFTMMSDACGHEGCPAYERQLLLGWGAAILLLGTLFGISFPLVRRISNFGGKVAVLVIFMIMAPAVPLLIGSILSGLAP